MHLLPAQADVVGLPVHDNLEVALVEFRERPRQQAQERLRGLVRLQHPRLPASEHRRIFRVFVGHSGADKRRQDIHRTDELRVAS